MYGGFTLFALPHVGQSACNARAACPHLKHSLYWLSGFINAPHPSHCLPSAGGGGHGVVEGGRAGGLDVAGAGAGGGGATPAASVRNDASMDRSSAITSCWCWFISS